MTDMFPIPIQKQDRASQTFCLSFHEKNKTFEHDEQRFVGRDHFQNVALSGPEKFFLFHSGDVAAYDDPA
jgi:hypothetical protein